MMISQQFRTYCPANQNQAELAEAGRSSYREQS